MRHPRKQQPINARPVDAAVGRQLEAGRAADRAWREERREKWARRVWRVRRGEAAINRYIGVGGAVVFFGFWGLLGVSAYFKRPIYWLFYAWLSVLASVFLAMMALFTAVAIEKGIRKAARGDGVDLG